MEFEGESSSSSVCTNGKQVAGFRRLKGLTQKQLAKIAGYSERLVRKAEAGGSLSAQTVRDLASALGHEGVTIFPEDLICSPEQLALDFLKAFGEYQTEMLTHVKHFIDPEIILVCAGDPKKIPFAGEWIGHEGMDRWVRTFFATLLRPEKNYYKPSVLSHGNTVVTWGQDLAHVPNLPALSMWVTQRFEFQQGKLIRFDNMFDTESGSTHLAEARARGFLTD